MERGIKNPAVIDAMKDVKRHYFVTDNLKTRAYDDCAIELMPDQTISQPYIVALMIELLDPQRDNRILEIGTGSGWQTTILSKLVKEVYSIDIKDTLFNFAEERIKRYGNNNVYLKIDDGSKGWEEKSPFDKIIVSCATTEIPQKLVDQLKNGGRMVLPVEKEGKQKLNLIKKDEEGKIKTEESIDVIFVKMKR